MRKIDGLEPALQEAKPRSTGVAGSAPVVEQSTGLSQVDKVRRTEEIDDGEDELFTCGDIGLGHLLDALEEVTLKDDDDSRDIELEGHPTIFISRFDDEIEIENRDDDNLWTVGANKDDLVRVLKQFVVDE